MIGILNRVLWLRVIPVCALALVGFVLTNEKTFSVVEEAFSGSMFAGNIVVEIPPDKIGTAWVWTEGYCFYYQVPNSNPVLDSDYLILKAKGPFWGDWESTLTRAMVEIEKRYYVSRVIPCRKDRSYVIEITGIKRKPPLRI